MITTNTKRSFLLSILAVCAFIAPLPAHAIQFELGGSLATVVMRVAEDKPDSSSGGAVAVMATKASYVPYFSLVGDERYFGETTNFGWNYQIWGSPFEVDQQEIDGKFSDDFDTKMEGSYFYATPLLFYRFGDRMASKPVRDWRITLAMGYGVSYADMKGNIRLTKKSSDTTAETKDISVSGLYLSFGLLVRATYKKFFFSVSNNTPQIKDSDNDLIFRINSVAYSLGYTFSFDFEFDNLFN